MRSPRPVHLCASEPDRWLEHPAESPTPGLLIPPGSGLFAARWKLDFSFLSIDEKNIDHRRVQYLERESRLRRNNDELLDFVGRCGSTLQSQRSCPKSIRIEVVIFHRHVAPDLVLEIRRLISPANVDSSRRGFHDFDSLVSQLLVHQRFDASTKPSGGGMRFGPFVAHPCVVLACPERDVARATPEDKPRTRRQKRPPRHSDWNPRPPRNP